jgi:hypothetical protein
MRRLLRIGMVAVVLALGAGCVSSQQRREKFVLENPGVSVEHREAILNGQIFIGMTADEVRAAWAIDGIWRGAQVNTTITASGRKEQWVLGGVSSAKYLYFTNGVLTCIQN